MSHVLEIYYKEGVLKPSLDYYYGRPVESNKLTKNGLEITLVGGVVIRTDDTDFTVADDELAGFALGTAVFSAGATRLVFVRGWNKVKKSYEETKEIAFKPTEYAIIDQAYEGGESHFPQRVVDAPVGGPVPHPDGAVVDEEAPEEVEAEETPSDGTEGEDGS